MVLQETIILLSFRTKDLEFLKNSRSPYSSLSARRIRQNINPEGCGLGLSVVKAIMCAHGGDVSYSLTPENGSLSNSHGLFKGMNTQARSNLF